VILNNNKYWIDIGNWNGNGLNNVKFKHSSSEIQGNVSFIDAIMVLEEQIGKHSKACLPIKTNPYVAAIVIRLDIKLT
jgi:hypothetical protein